MKVPLRMWTDLFTGQTGHRAVGLEGGDGAPASTATIPSPLVPRCPPRPAGSQGAQEAGRRPPASDSSPTLICCFSSIPVWRPPWATGKFRFQPHPVLGLWAAAAHKAPFRGNKRPEGARSRYRIARVFFDISLELQPGLDSCGRVKKE